MKNSKSTHLLFLKKFCLKFSVTQKIVFRANLKPLPFLRIKLSFWAQIYTQFTGDQVLIHDRRDLSIVYDAINFAPLKKSNLSRYKTAQKKRTATRKKVKRIRTSLFELSRMKKPKSKHAKQLQKHLIRIKVKRPKGASRKNFFTALAMNLRVQTGQRDKIFQGILNIYPFENIFNKLFKTFNLPKELLAISFVESSFNPKATSKVGASGVWQIMPFIDKKILPQGKGIDSRRNVILSTLGALHLLSQNFKILKRWDTAVTAYNSGTKHLLRARKRFRKKNADLAYILKRYRSRHLGFASKNFFSEFLALVYILEYKELLFPLDGINYMAIEKNPKIRYNNINVYISKCGFMPERFYASLKKSSPYLKHINNHLKHDKRIYSRGTVLFSDVHLSPRLYHKLPFIELKKRFPQKYFLTLKNKKCRALK